MEHRSAACETLARADAVAVLRCVFPRAGCARNESLVSEDAATLSRNRLSALDSALAIPPSARGEKRPPSATDAEDDCWFEDLADYSEIVEELILNPFTRIIKLIFEDKETLVRIAMIF